MGRESCFLSDSHHQLGTQAGSTLAAPSPQGGEGTKASQTWALMGWAAWPRAPTPHRAAWTPNLHLGPCHWLPGWCLPMEGLSRRAGLDPGARGVETGHPHPL